MINIFFGFWKKFSIVLLAIVVLYCYASLPESIAITHDSQGKPIRFIDKQVYFYVASAVGFLFNLLMTLLGNQLQKADFSKIFPNSEWAQKPLALRELLRGWQSAFVAIINTFLIFAILGLNNINAGKNQTLDFNYNWMLLLGGALLMILIFVVPLRLLFSTPRNIED